MLKGKLLCTPGGGSNVEDRSGVRLRDYKLYINEKFLNLGSCCNKRIYE